MATTNQRQRITIFINHLLVTHAKAQALIDNTTLASLVEKALITYLPSEIFIKKIKI